ncbi:CDP-alcohol phosphatidyltransferase family protein [Oceanobacillus caeni]|uniref:CDP-diacylglycerol--glycerol-3-phosphate 3-phosphatidyltransferase n=1 Tax=Oceanobacillus caeni TaxID=405946 RepID=A0ABR5MFF4_9BACI|nr:MULTISPECIES: CDP-alcohol phosphatidyltransferase family protein [Bacillaceae]KKE77655.1 CDP-diacylglycerol--glycerol-3-phosphate 3-phosphatidyltransferase [Bacilli bacterium VT-13-104]PZD83860.1 CDP-alcohol phosphatidyltransferase family protein [Bacilli bacterium]KPH69267.1 CDP-diacylglycerol--glycerol-3-phosphate 3-phosphatidyltransferase [Oceanobacillus caeni]MBU8791454.1 CDP-alcohol phosphatidyltransferase family protein [Oceanobacillus caeni]MCR1833817.1 CDP-alcohol phosphatidyltransf
MKLTKREWLTIPNILSCIRILLIPFFIYIYFSATETNDYYIAAFIIFLSGLTDLLDGFIARKFNQITELGKTLDPIADKLTQAAIVICLVFHYPYMWILVLLVVLKELFMGINGLILLKKGKKLDGSKWFGKVSTTVFYVAMGLFIAFPELNLQVAAILVITTGIFLTISFIMYALEFIHLYRA